MGLIREVDRDKNRESEGERGKERIRGEGREIESGEKRKMECEIFKSNLGKERNKYVRKRFGM